MDACASQRVRALPSKPMVPTAPSPLNRHALPSWRRQTSQSLGSVDERGAADEKSTGRARRVVVRDELLETSADLREGGRDDEGRMLIGRDDVATGRGLRYPADEPLSGRGAFPL